MRVFRNRAVPARGTAETGAQPVPLGLDGFVASPLLGPEVAAPVVLRSLSSFTPLHLPITDGAPEQLLPALSLARQPGLVLSRVSRSVNPPGALSTTTDEARSERIGLHVDNFEPSKAVRLLRGVLNLGPAGRFVHVSPTPSDYFVLADVRSHLAVAPDIWTFELAPGEGLLGDLEHHVHDGSTPPLGGLNTVLLFHAEVSTTRVPSSGPT